MEQQVIEVLNAGGMPALAAALIYAVRYMAAQLRTVQLESREAHQQTIGLLRDTVRDNTIAMQEVRTVLVSCHNRRDTEQRP